MSSTYVPGLQGVVAAQTRLSSVNGEIGELIIAGYYSSSRRRATRSTSRARSYKPHRVIKTNVEFVTALVLHGLDIPVELFTPTFAVARVAGWCAHVAEQRSAGKLIQPNARYTGPASV
jgi:citrate synthase